MRTLRHSLGVLNDCVEMLVSVIREADSDPGSSIIVKDLDKVICLSF
jgi:hypothetical protein